MGLRTYEVMSYFTARKAILNAQIAYPAITFRNIVGPKASWWRISLGQLWNRFFKVIPISYSTSDVSTQMEQGYEDAKAAMSTP